MPITEGFTSRLAMFGDVVAKMCYGPPKEGHLEKKKKKATPVTALKAGGGPGYNPYRLPSGLFASKHSGGAPRGFQPKDAMRVENLLKEGPKAHARAAQMAKSITTWEKAHRRANAATHAGQHAMAKIFRQRADEIKSGQKTHEQVVAHVEQHLGGKTKPPPATIVTPAEVLRTGGSVISRSAAVPPLTQAQAASLGLNPQHLLAAQQKAAAAAYAQHIKPSAEELAMRAGLAAHNAKTQALGLGLQNPKGTGSAFEKFMQAKQKALSTPAQVTPATTVKPAEAAHTAGGAKPSDAHMGPRPTSSDPKDSMRIENMAKAAGGDKAKFEKQATAMAKSITDWKKAHRRANAAEFDNYHSIAAIFRARADAIAASKK